MKNRLFQAILMIIISAPLIISCGKLPVSPSHTDWDAVKEIIFENPEIFSLGFYNTTPDTPFYREITESHPDIDDGKLIKADSIHWVDRITLTWSDWLYGNFHYYLDGKSYEKPCSSYTSTNAYFERWGNASDPHRGWFLKKISGTNMGNPGSPPLIYGLSILPEGSDTTIDITNLLSLVRPDSTLIFKRGKQVTFTIHIFPSESLAFVSLFVKEGKDYQKIPLTSIEKYTKSASWITTNDPEIAKGYHHAIVDAVTYESVADTTSKFHYMAWGIIYRIE
ncbi:MAG: hypothetical protein ABII96_07240 [Candidatus Zixiibacteriota bacterium]